MSSLQERIAAVQARIRQAEAAAGRAAGSVTLVAVSKTFPAARIAEAYRAGLRDFGESYVQEALAKRLQLEEPDIVWHFLGPIQSNKTKQIAGVFQWVHSVDRLKIAERLNEHRPIESPPLNVLIQVNISGEASKSGVALGEVSGLASGVLALPRLRLRGLMAIPKPHQAFDEQRAAFRRLREALAGLPGGHGLDSLSMGMSDDLEAAVMEGATLVRVGTAIFGDRAT